MTVRGFPMLQWLDISHCNLIRDRGLNEISQADYKPPLLHLNLRCDRITRVGLVSIAGAFPNLQSLDIRGCDYVNPDQVVAELAFLVFENKQVMVVQN